MMSNITPTYDIFEGVLADYQILLKKRETFRVLLQRYTNVPNESSFINIQSLSRFTERYRKRVYYQIAPMKSLKPHAFMTFTFPQDDYSSITQYETGLEYQRKAWSKIRAWIAKYLGEFAYFRVYELTKSNNLHIHCLIFSPFSKEQFEKLAQYAHNNHGFVDLKRFTYDDKFTYAWKYWINEKSKNAWTLHDVKETFPKGSDGKYNAVTNYVMKYQLKDPSLLHQAIFTKYRIRTYSVSKNLRFMLNKIKPKHEWKKISSGYYNPILDKEKNIPESLTMTIDEKKQLSELVRANMEVSVLSVIKYIDGDPSGTSMMNRIIPKTIPKPHMKPSVKVRTKIDILKNIISQRPKPKKKVFPTNYRFDGISMEKIIDGLSMVQYVYLSMGLSLFIDEVRGSLSIG